MLNTELVLKNYFTEDPKKQQEVLKKLGLVRSQSQEFRQSITITPTRATTDFGSAKTAYSLSINDVPIITFNLRAYPNCCALGIIYGFSYYSSLPSDLLQKLLDAAFADTVAEYTTVDHYFNIRRVQIMMVEHRLFSTAEIKEATEKGDYSLVDWQPRESPSISYPEIYAWAKRQPKCVDTLMYNPNSKRIIHNLEVIFKPKGQPLFDMASLC